MIERRLDVLIVGGGGAGLWLLDRVRRHGFSTLLVEKTALGSGQTIASQGIIHGGLKYTLSGMLNTSARAIRDMPELWRKCLAGQSEPDLRDAVVRSPQCYLWRSQSIRSRVAMLGAQKGLRSAAAKMTNADRPTILRDCPGDVFSVAEQVLDVASLLKTLSIRNKRHIILGEIRFAPESTNAPITYTVTEPQTNRSINIQADHVVLTAGAGNATLIDQPGLSTHTMQRRPLHMVMARGDLPELYGHCVDWDKTRATITSATDSNGRNTWYIGGQISEDGVKMKPDELVRHARNELTEIIPNWCNKGLEWATFRVDRAEAKTTTGFRPTGPEIRQKGPIITAWPTKLALVPELSNMITRTIKQEPEHDDSWIDELADWSKPKVARYPWEEVKQWRQIN